MLPGFELNEAIVASKLDFDVIRLETDEVIQDPDSPRGVEYMISTQCIEDLQQVIDEYYEFKPEILDFISPGSSFSMRVYSEDAEVVAKKLASEILIEFSDPIEASDHETDQEIEPQTYSEFVGDYYDISLDIEWDDLSDTQVDVQQELEESTPSGINSPSFTREDYGEFVTEFAFEPVVNSNWSGGHAWLINLAIRELRNGRYESAAYGFEGARHGLTKKSHWDDNRIRLLMDTCLASLRNLCIEQGEEGDPFGDISLSCGLENRDLIFYPNFVHEPSFDDPNFRFSTKSWIANVLVLVQSVAHIMENPTISRTEIDPFGTNLTQRNISFVLNISRALIEQDDLERHKEGGEEKIQKLQLIDFTEHSPDIALTRVLDSHDYYIDSYGTPTSHIGTDIEIKYDLLVRDETQRYIVRALRNEDRDPETINRLNAIVEGEDEQILLLYDQEVSNEVLESIENNNSVYGYYVDLVNERMRSLSSGYPRRFENLTTETEILERLDELLQAAEDAETTEEKGDTLEELMELIFQKAVPDTDVRDMNVRTRVEEIDLQLHNKGRRYPWDELGTRLPVECKNWSETAGVDVIYTIFGKTQMMSPSCQGAILVAWEGVSDSIEGRDGDQLIREIRQKDINLLVLDKEDLEQIIETGDAQSIFENKADELWAR